MNFRPATLSGQNTNARQPRAHANPTRNTPTMTTSNKIVYALIYGAAAAFFVAIGSGKVLAANTLAMIV